MVLVVAFATKDDDEFRVVVVRRLHVTADVSLGVRIDDTPWSASSFAPRVMMMRETLILRPPHASPLVVKVVVVVKVAISLKKGDDGLFCRSALRHTYTKKERILRRDLCPKK